MAMKWIPLDGKKDPEFDTKMIIILQGTNLWLEAFLKKIEATSSGKRFVFTQERECGDNGYEYISATHFMYIEPPKNNT